MRLAVVAADTVSAGGAGGSSGIGGAGGSGGSQAGGNATASRGSGGGGAGSPTSSGANANGGNGSGGVVIVRTADTVATAATTGAPTVTTAGGYKVYLFEASGTIEF
jgi:hypothetical protein